MTDYDSRKIPVLDDVIEITDNETIDFDLSDNIIEIADDEKIDFDLSIDSTEQLDSKIDTTENSFDLFANEALSTTEDSGSGLGEATTTNTLFEDTTCSETEPQVGVIDNSKNQAEDSDNTLLNKPAETAESEEDSIESALINYDIPAEVETSIINPIVIDEPVDNQTVEVASQTTLSLQSVTDDIVKQLMPELEQQLRLLLKQALKEKLPEEIAQPLSDETASVNKNPKTME